MKNIKSPTNGKPDTTVVQVSGSIIAGGTAKPELANSPVTLVEVGDQRDAGVAALAEETVAREAWMTKRAARREKFKTLRTTVKRYALYANAVYGGDKVKLQALGLTVIEGAPLVGVLPAPQNLRSRPGKLNQSIDLLWNAVRGREGHELQRAESAQGPWNEIYRGKKTKATCAGLESGKEYYFRLRAWGLAGPGTWSDITSTRAT